MGFVLVLTALATLNLLWPVAHRVIKIWGLLVWGLIITSLNSHLVVSMGVSFFVSLPPLAFFTTRAAIANKLGEMEQGQVRVIDHLIGVVGGVLAAGTAFRVIGNAAAGTEWALGAHLVGLALSLFLGLAACVVPSVLRSAAAATGVAFLMLTLLSWVWFPVVVQTEAEAWAQGAPFTLASTGQPLTPSQLTFLTMPKNEWEPHAVLSFETEDGTCHAAWSYGYRTFRTDNWLVDSSACPAAPPD